MTKEISLRERLRREGLGSAIDFAKTLGITYSGLIKMYSNPMRKEEFDRYIKAAKREGISIPTEMQVRAIRLWGEAMEANTMQKLPLVYRELLVRIKDKDVEFARDNMQDERQINAILNSIEREMKAVTC